MSPNPNASVQRRATYVALSSLYLALVTGFSLFKQKREKPEEFKTLDLAMLGLAAYRLGRLVAYDKVFETARSPFTQTVPHESGAGEMVIPRGSGAREALGELISCPICSGTWVTAFLVMGLQILPAPTRTLIKIMSAMGISEFLNAATEALQWTGEMARMRTGALSREIGTGPAAQP